jgi:hypothetical protein
VKGNTSMEEPEEEPEEEGFCTLQPLKGKEQGK